MSKPSWFIAFRTRLSLEGSSPPIGVRLLHKEDHHLTVAFLGKIDAPRAERAWTELGTHLPPHGFTAQTNACEFFGGKTPNAIAAEIKSPLASAWVQRVRSSLLLAADCVPDERPFRAHVTLARLRRRISSAERAQANLWMRSVNPEPKEVRLKTIALYTWAPRASADEPRYMRTHSHCLDR